MLRKCRIKNFLYKCRASTPPKLQRVYTGISEYEWIKRYYNHTKSFRKKPDKNELSNYLWKIKKETGEIPILTWSIVRTVPAYCNTTKKCTVPSWKIRNTSVSQPRKNFK